MSAASSDPALFSGDESVPGAEDYANKRKKNLYTGSWWSHRMKANRDDKQREFKRNYDSGIFMGSEASEPPSSDSLGSLEDELIQDQRRKELDDQTTATMVSSKSRPLLRAPSFIFKPSMPEVLPEHGVVMQIVQRCLDKGEESVDLASMSLTSLPSQILSLKTLMKNTNLVSGMLEYGETFETHLRLFVSNNLLRRVPREILDLTNLRELSLRRNKLTSIPPGIRSLVNLETLNISGNKLSFLPFEIVELVRWHRLRTIKARPNQWLPTPRTEDLSFPIDWQSPSAWMHLTRWQRKPLADSVTSSEAVPSLTEMTLRSLSRLTPQSDFRQFMPPDTSETVLTALGDLYDSQLDGGHRCSRCNKTVVRAGHVELEWWELDELGVSTSVWRPLPVKRMYCHRDCDGQRNRWCDEPKPNDKADAAVMRMF
jgi:Leucine Rich repeats (2 copies)